ncbi:MAG: hypothetical protein ACK41O_26920 [Runella zeae]
MFPPRKGIITGRTAQAVLKVGAQLLECSTEGTFCWREQSLSGVRHACARVCVCVCVCVCEHT